MRLLISPLKSIINAFLDGQLVTPFGVLATPCLFCVLRRFIVLEFFVREIIQHTSSCLKFFIKRKGTYKYICKSLFGWLWKNATDKKDNRLGV